MTYANKSAKELLAEKQAAKAKPKKATKKSTKTTKE